MINENNKIKNILGYIRVSTQEQTENFSINNQKNDIKNKCDKEKWNLIDVYSDEGITGTDIKVRKGLTDMLDYIEKNSEKVDAIVIWKLSRISRNVGDLANILKFLDKYDVKLISIMDNFDTSTSMGTMFVYIAGVFAEMERDNIVIQLKGGMKQRALEGKFNGGIVPIGYDYNKGDNYLTLNEKEAITVKKIFELYVKEGYGYKKITQWLNPRRSTYSTKKGASWSIGTVKGVIDNPVYIGKMRWGVHKDWSKKRRKGTSDEFILVDSKHEPIISMEIWEAAEKKRSNATIPKKKANFTHLLSGLVKCPSCGASMVSHKIQKRNKSGYHRYYICSQYTNKGKDICGTNLVKAEEAEILVITRIKDFIGQDDIIEILQNHINVGNKDTKLLEEDLIQLDKEILKREKEHNKYYEYLVDEDKLQKLTVEKLLQLIEETKQRICNLEVERSKITAQIDCYKQTDLDFEKMVLVLKNFDKLLSKANNEEKVKLMKVLIKEIKVNNSDDINQRTIKEIALQLGGLILFMENNKGNCYEVGYEMVNRTIINRSSYIY